MTIHHQCGLTPNEAEDVVRRSTPCAKSFLTGFTIVSVLLLLIYFTPYFEVLRVGLAYALPLALGVGVVLVVQFVRHGWDPLPRGALFGGWLFAVGGVALDAGATIINTPTLEQETNVIARALLDSGHAVGFVYVYGALSQALYLLMVCALWAGFLRHRRTLIAHAMGTHPTSGFEFIKAATGGADRSWRQYFLPLIRSELPTSYPCTMLLAAVLLGSMSFSWYLGLSWLRALPVNHPGALVICLAASVSVYVAWLWAEYRQTRHTHGRSP